MRVADEHHPSSAKKLASLTFEDFLECMCRVSAMKAWPDPEVVLASGKRDALEYLVWCKKNDFKNHETLMQTRAVPWNGTLHLQPAQCVDNLLRGVIRTIEEGAEVALNGNCSLKEVRDFRKKKLRR